MGVGVSRTRSRSKLSVALIPARARTPVAYSVGENGTDEVATGVVPLAPTPQFSWNNGDVDYRRDLTRWHNPPAWAAPLTRWLRRGPAGRSTTAPAAPDGASPEAVDDEPDEADEPGEEGEGQQR